ncbi:MAG: cation diffusion facilitator family transporter, partial [candidate division Zixibacteria bacterium]|nr:cation diffusion facilitator family transporter [candidate division Zixibacteria bacterium]
MSEQDTKSGINVTLAGMFINIALVVFKLWVGIIGKSQALIADGVHSLSDLFSDLIVILGIRWGRKDPDEDHPFGHRRIETIASLIVGFFLVSVGIGIIYDAIIKITENNFYSPSIYVIYVAAGSIISKEILFWYTRSVGQKIKSTVIMANAWHHRTDALSSVAVLIGVLFVYINPKFYLADIIAAIIVSLLIMQVGASLIWSALKEVVDTAPDKEILAKIEQHAERIEGVKQAHDIRARFSGALILVEIHIVVDPDLTVREGHNIAKQVEHRLL